LPVYSVDTADNAKMLLTLACKYGYDGKYRLTGFPTDAKDDVIKTHFATKEFDRLYKLIKKSKQKTKKVLRTSHLP